jgi:hypothetical protein
MSAESSTGSGVPFGSTRRDWTFIWRGVVFVFSSFSAIGMAILLYAGNTYIKAQAQSIVQDEVAPLKDLPIRVQAIERESLDREARRKELADWRNKKDEIDVRLTVLLENQQKLLEHQQTQIDNMSYHR